MKHFPRRTELAILGCLAVICAIVICQATSRDVALSLLGFPIFVVAGLMGAARAGLLSGRDDLHRGDKQS